MGMDTKGSGNKDKFKIDFDSIELGKNSKTDFKTDKSKNITQKIEDVEKAVKEATAKMFNSNDKGSLEKNIKDSLDKFDFGKKGDGDKDWDYHRDGKHSPEHHSQHQPTPAPTNTIYGTPDDDVITATGLNNTIKGKEGHDFIRVDNAKATNNLSGEIGNDIMFSNGKQTTFNGGVGDDIMKSWGGAKSSADSGSGPGKGCSNDRDHSSQYDDKSVGLSKLASLLSSNNDDVGGPNTFVGDSRMYNASAAYSAPTLLTANSTAAGAFLGGGHDIVHGRNDSSGKVQDILELKGYGWYLKLFTSNGEIIIDSSNARSYVGSDGSINLKSLGATSGIAVSDIKGSIHLGDLTVNGNVGENGLETFSFDRIAKIKFTDGGIGSSNAAHGLFDSSLAVLEKTAQIGSTTVKLIADANSIISGSGGFSMDNVIFGQNNNNSFDLRSITKDELTPTHDLIYTGNGNKTVITDHGTDMVIGGKGDINVNLWGYGYKSFIAVDDAMNAGSHYDVTGGFGFTRIDVGSFKGDWTLTVGNTTTHYNSLTDGGNIVLGANVDGSIHYGGGTINFHSIDHITY